MAHRRNLTLLLAAASLALSIPRARAQDQMPILTNHDPKATSSDPKISNFDVATVKKNKSDTHMMRIMMKPDGFACDNIPLKTLIAQAYGIKQDLISGGPDWVDSEGFDVDAKVLGPTLDILKSLTPEDLQSMLQSLLAERFNLKLHRETKTLPIYELVVAKGGAKLKELPPIDPTAEEAKAPADRRRLGATSTGPGEFNGEAVIITNLADHLAYIVHHPVTDKTGLTGIYDINLKWTPEDQPAEAATEVDCAQGKLVGPCSQLTGPTIFTALQEQLGLKLQSSKGPVETLVIDHADPPSEN